MKKLKPDTEASFIPVMQFFIGLGVFGFIYWLLNGILDIFIDEAIHETGTIWSFMTYIWAGILIIYLLFGGIWMIKKYNEEQYANGGF